MPTQADLALQTIQPPAGAASAAQLAAYDQAYDAAPDIATKIALGKQFAASLQGGSPPQAPDANAPAAPAIQAGGSQADAALAALTAAPSTAAPTGQPLAPGESFLKGLNDITTAGGQMLAHGLPQGAVDAVNNATQYVNNLPGIGPVTQALGMVPATVQQVDQNAKEGEAQYQADRQASVPQGQTPGIDGGRIGGNILGTLPLTAAEAPAALSTALSRVPVMAKMLLQGGAVGALSQPVTSGDYAEEKGKQALVGALSSGGTSALASAISPTVSAGVQALRKAGVTPTMGQILGGTAARVEQAATSIPVLGDFIKNAQRRSVEQLNTAAINRSLNPIGQSVPKGMDGRAALGHAIDTLSDAYDKVVSKIGSVKPDETFLSNVANLQGLTGNMAKAQAEQFGRILDNEVLGRIDKKGRMTGEALKAAESSLGKMAKGYRGSQDYDVRELGLAISQTQAELREMLARVRPEVAPELAGINKGYANLMPVQRAASYVDAEGGVFSPAQLQGAVKANDPSLNKRAFARGSALMQDLSDPAKSVLGSKLPDSGTPYRHGVQVLGAALLGHGMLPEGASHWAIPAAIGGTLAAVPYTALGQKAASVLLTKRPAGAAQLAAVLQRSAPYAALAAPALAPSAK